MADKGFRTFIPAPIFLLLGSPGAKMLSHPRDMTVLYGVPPDPLLATIMSDSWMPLFPDEPICSMPTDASDVLDRPCPCGKVLWRFTAQRRRDG